MTGARFGAFGGIFGGLHCLIRRYRHREDIWNMTLAGFGTGALVELPSRDIQLMARNGAIVAVISAALYLFSGPIYSYPKERPF